MIAMAQLTQEIIDAAIEGFEMQKRRIDEQIAELRGMSDGSSGATTAPKKTGGMSAARRAAIAEAQRKRWAAKKGIGSVVKPAAPVLKKVAKKRKLSAQGRANIVAALKKR